MWNGHSTSPFQRYAEHTAAVKAISWSPHQHGLLASGGGTADRCIRFWNTGTQNPLQCVDTGSQVCNLGWSKNVNEIVSTHGYSQNQIIVWRYPGMSKLATLTGASRSPAQPRGCPAGVGGGGARGGVGEAGGGWAVWPRLREGGGRPVRAPR